MITLVNRDTCKYCHIPEEFITDMQELQVEDHERVYPYTRLHIVDPKQKHDYYLDVLDSVKYINKLIEQNKSNPPPAKKSQI